MLDLCLNHGVQAEAQEDRCRLFKFTARITALDAGGTNDLVLL